VKYWLLAGVLCSAVTLARSYWLAAPASGELPVSAALQAHPVRPIAAAQAIKPAPAQRRVAATAALPVAAVEPSYLVAQAQALMQLMAESGDPRQPAAGGLQPRTPATAAQLANPQAYAAFADEQSRAEVQAWTSGVQQIAQMRENIEQAAQSGERSSSEIDEARAALAQLEMLQNTLQRETPQSLPAVPASKP
jgi:soluble cytochrome b562